MELIETISFIKALSDGIDPVSGEIMSEDLVLNRPEIVRALNRAVQALEREVVDIGHTSIRPVNAYMPWSIEEDRLLVTEFSDGDSFDYLAKKHGRTQGAIKSRLAKFGLIEYDYLKLVEGQN